VCPEDLQAATLPQGPDLPSEDLLRCGVLRRGQGMCSRLLCGGLQMSEKELSLNSVVSRV